MIYYIYKRVLYTEAIIVKEDRRYWTIHISVVPLSGGHNLIKTDIYIYMKSRYVLLYCWTYV